MLPVKAVLQGGDVQVLHAAFAEIDKSKLN